jgi:hypothetical protein
LHKEFVPKKKTVNAKFHKGVMDRLLKLINPLNAELNPIFHLLALLGAHHILHVSRLRVKQVLPAAFFSRDFILLHDDAPAHKAANTCQF